MSNAIQFLETMGTDASRGRLSAAEYADAVAKLDADESQRRALMERDHAELNALLSGRETVMGYVATPNDDDWKHSDEHVGSVQNEKMCQAA